MSSSQPVSALGIDIGGSSCRAAVVASDGRILAQSRARTPRTGGPADLAEVIRRLAASVVKDVDPTARLAGLALPGIRDPETRILRRANNLSWLENTNVSELFTRALQRPIRIETDVNAAGLAQWRSLAPPPRRFVYLSVGTGIGGAVIIDRQIVRHTDDGPGHFGDLIVYSAPDAPAGRTGIPGCLEAVARDNAEPQRIARTLAIGLHQIASVYSPDTIAVGGGAIDHAPELIEQTRSQFAQLWLNSRGADIYIVRAPLRSDDAGITGAALLALERS
jgi:glucokinase